MSARRLPTRDDIVLLLADGAEGPYPFDPVRLMKSAFLVSQRGRPEWKPLFNFEAYDYGPFDRSVYDVRDRLIYDDLLEVIPGRYDRYRLTAAGEDRVSKLKEAFGEDADWIRRIGRYVTTRSFAVLLNEVYDAHPEFAVRSRFRTE